MAGLLLRVGAHYEFVNDLAQECVYRSLAQPLVSAYHRRAADLLSDQPESMAAHAHAAGEPGRAAQGWLLAGQAAMGRSAVEDAIGLYDRALAAAEEPLLRARVLLARARAQEASTAYAAALTDIDEALALARAGPDRRLEMAALRARGGDVPVALRLPSSEVGAHLEAGLRLATGLGDRAAEADFTSPADRARGEPAPSRERTRQGRGGPGARTCVVLGGGDPVRARRREDRPRLPRRGRPAARGRGRAGAAGCVSAGPPGCSSGPCSSRRSRPLPTAPGTRRRRSSRRPSRSTGTPGSGRTPGTSAHTSAGTHGSPETSTPRSHVVVRRSPRPHRSTTRGGTPRPRGCCRAPCSRPGRAQRPSPWPAADSRLPDRRHRKPGGCVASRHSP